MKPRIRCPGQLMARLVIASTFLFAILQLGPLFGVSTPVDRNPIALGITFFTTAIELIGGFYCLVLIFAAIGYLLIGESEPGAQEATGAPPLGVIYLCCNDLDPEALQSLAGLRYDGDLHLVVHDDSESLEARAGVDAVVEELRLRDHLQVLLLRRPEKGGGKAGAVNFVLEKTGHLYDYFLLCDNDTSVPDDGIIRKALPYFEDESIAVVQGRSIAVDSPDQSPINQLLSRSIDAFHLFLTVGSRFGWSVFIGHNAFLRTRAVREVGGFTRGFFSDDLDLTLRLNLKGYSVAYAPEIRLGEKHPPSYFAFRKRSYKWAYGCMQILKAHAWTVLTTPRLSLAEKLGFFQFAGFYAIQSLMLLYLVVRYVLSPMLLGPQPFNATANLVMSCFVIVVIFLPSLAYFLKDRTLATSAGTVLLCGLVYGTADFCCTRGVWDCLRGRRPTWVPTNMASSGHRGLDLVAEALFGFILLSVPLFSFPTLLYLPTTYLFAGKFLFGPALSVMYTDPRRRIRLARPRLGLEMEGVALIPIIAIAFVLLAMGPAQAKGESPGEAARVEVRGRCLYLDGRPFLVQGVHYSPWRPGTGPGKDYPYPGPEAIEEDLRQIRRLNANTILVYDAPEYVFDLAHRHGLKVIHTFHIDWWTFGTAADGPIRAGILERGRRYRDKPALLAWVLGNEVPSYLFEQRGRSIRDAIESLYHSLKEVDLRHPITHSGWPVTREMDLKFLDMASFNLYPLWPPEVVAMGYGHYIKEVLQPIAGEKPLLMTEFGVNTIEVSAASQARLLKQCWESIREAETCGGVVFEFADEWWKNYSNPRGPGDWWDRAEAPDDERRHDRDPEEYYGIMDADRRPKPGAAAVREMFAPRGGDRRTVPAIFIGLVTTLAFGSWYWARRSRPAPETAG